MYHTIVTHHFSDCTDMHKNYHFIKKLVYLIHELALFVVFLDILQLFTSVSAVYFGFYFHIY